MLTFAYYLVILYICWLHYVDLFAGQSHHVDLLTGQPAYQFYITQQKNITSLLEFCLTSTYFIFQGRYFEQQEGAAMGSPISPIVTNLYMENFANKAINSAPQLPLFWRRFVDDTFTILQSSQKNKFPWTSKQHRWAHPIH